MDHLHDKGFAILRESNDIPDFVKTASSPDSHTLYAYHDGLEGYFPIDTPKDTWLSARYFEKNASCLPEEAVKATAAKLHDALAFHKVAYEIASVEKQEDALMKLASEFDNFEHGYRSLPPERRHHHAQVLRDRFESLKHLMPEGVRMPERVRHYAGEHLNPKWHDSIVNRLRLSGAAAHEDYNAILDDSEHVETMNPFTIAKLLEFIDRKHGVHEHWDKRINDPYMDMITDEAPVVKRIIIMKINKRPYYDSDLDRIDKNELREHLSEDAIDQLFSHKESFDGLPDEIKHILARLMS